MLFPFEYNFYVFIDKLQAFIVAYIDGENAPDETIVAEDIEIRYNPGR